MKRTRRALLLLTLIAVLVVPAFAGGQEEAATGSGRGHVSVTLPDRGTVPPHMGTIEDNHWVEWFERNAPIDVEFVGLPSSGIEEVLNTRLASGTAPDVLYSYNTAWRVGLKQRNLIQPIGDAIDQWSTEYKALLEAFPMWRRLGLIDGELYQIGRNSGLTSGMGLMIRSDWLENVGLDVPETAEELFNVARAFTEEDPNRSGRDDTYGMGLAANSNFVIDMMFQNVIWIEEDGRMVKDWDRVVAATEFKERLYNAGYTDPDFVTDINGERTLSDFMTGKVGIIGRENIPRSQGYHTYVGLKENIPDAEILIIPLPRTEFGQFSPPPMPPIQMTGVINARKSDLEPVVEFIDFMANQETQLVLRHGFEGIHHQRNPENGCFLYDAEKYSEEIAWNSQIHMLYNRGLEGDCFKYKETLDPAHPLSDDWARLHDMAEEAYVWNPLERPWPQLIAEGAMPPLPQDLELMYSNIEEAYTDVWVRAIVGGSDFTTQDALSEARTIWNSGGGPLIEEYYETWYAENEETAITNESLIDLAVRIKAYNDRNWRQEPMKYRNPPPEGWGTDDWWSR